VHPAKYSPRDRFTIQILTAWFSIIDDEWPQVRRAFDLWLAPENFAAEGRQLHSLASLRAQE
jgi:hypothetical protein